MKLYTFSWSVNVVIAMASMLASCGGGGTSSEQQTVATGSTVDTQEIAWVSAGKIAGITPESSYNALFFMNESSDDEICVFSNFNGTDNTTAAKIYKQCGTISQGVSPPAVALDLGPNLFVRTLGGQRMSDGTLYLFPRVGAYYGSPGGYQPHLVISDKNGENWKDQGQAIAGYQDDSNSLVVNPNAPSAPKNKSESKCVAYTDGLGVRIALIYNETCSGKWSVYTDAAGKAVEMWPVNDPSVNGVSPQFSAVTKTEQGLWFMLSVDFDSVRGAAKRLILLGSCDGLHWKTLESSSPAFDGSPKGATIVYRQRTKRVYALNVDTLMWFPVVPFTCPS